MTLVLNKVKTNSLPTGWDVVTINSAVTGDYQGKKFYDLTFEGIPEACNVRVWESISDFGDKSEYAIANLFRYSNPNIKDEIKGEGDDVAISVDDTPDALIGKRLNVYFFKNNKGYTDASSRILPAEPFQNAISEYSLEWIERKKQEIANKINVTTGTNNVTDIPF